MNAYSKRLRRFSFALLFVLASCGGGGSSVTPGSSSGPGPVPALNAGSALAKSYTVVDLGPAPGSPWFVPVSVNDSGSVALNSSASPLSSLPCPVCTVPSQAWVYQGGKLQQLPPLPGNTETFVGSINNHGDMVGGSTGAGLPETAVLWKSDLSIVNLGTGIATPGSSAEADGISDSGLIDGVSYNATQTLPTFFDGKGGAVDPCGSGVQGYFRNNGINDAGVGVGDELLSAGGTAVMTCPPFAAIETPSNPAWLNFGFGINDSGTVVGRLSVGPAKKNFHPFMYQGGKTTDLGTLFPSSPNAVGAAFGINQGGLIVGWTAESGGTIGTPPVPPVNPRAFAYSNGKMVDLNTLLPASCANWTLIVADDVSNNGYIVGVAFVNGYPGGSEHAFLMVPHD